MAETEKNNRPVKDEALRYLEYRARTAAETKKHLKEKGYSQEEIQECMEFLLDCHFIDDEDYCYRYIQYAMEKGRGPRRISQELAQKGISGSVVSAGLEELYDPQMQRAAALSQAKKALGIFREEEVGDRLFTEKELAKAARRLLSQGFSQSVVYDVFGRLKRG